VLGGAAQLNPVGKSPLLRGCEGDGECRESGGSAALRRLISSDLPSFRALPRAPPLSPEMPRLAFPKHAAFNASVILSRWLLSASTRGDKSAPLLLKRGGWTLCLNETS